MGGPPITQRIYWNITQYLCVFTGTVQESFRSGRLLGKREFTDKLPCPEVSHHSPVLELIAAIVSLIGQCHVQLYRSQLRGGGRSDVFLEGGGCGAGHSLADVTRGVVRLRKVTPGEPEVAGPGRARRVMSLIPRYREPSTT